MVNVYLSGQDARNAAADLWQQDQLQRVNDQYAPPPQPAPEPAQAIPPPAPVEAAGVQGSSLPPSPAVGPVRATPVFPIPAAVTPNPTPDRNDIADQWQRGAIADAWEKNALSDVYKGVSQAGQGVQSALSQVPQQAQGLTSNLSALPGAQPTPSAQPAPAQPTGIPAPQPTAGQAATVAGGGDFQSYARQAAQRNGVDPDIFQRQIQQESGFNPSAQSPAGAQGIAQFMPATAQGMGVDPSDPYASLDGAARLMKQNLDRYGGDYSRALAAYNAGPGNVDKYGGVPPFQETQTYVKNILGGVGQAAGNVGQQLAATVQPIAKPADDWLAIAKEQLGKPYIWGSAGGRSTFDPNAPGFDCSGFVAYVMKKAFGVDLPAFTGSAYTATRPLDQGETPGSAGQVAFYNMGQSDPHLQHIALSIGNGQVIQAGGRRNDVNTDVANDIGTPEWRVPVGIPDAMSQAAQQVVGAGVQAAQQVGQNAQQAVQQTAQGLINTVGNLGQGIGSAWQQAGQQNAANPMMQNMIASSSPSTINPYRDIVQQGVPNIIGGIQTGDIGRVLGGGLQTIGGITSALPGGEGQIAGRAATTVGEVASNPAVQAALRSRLPGEVEAGFAMGLPTGEIRPPGGGPTVPPVPPQGGDTALQSLIDAAKQRGYDTADLESQIRPPGVEPPPPAPPAPPTTPPTTTPAAPEPPPGDFGANLQGPTGTPGQLPLPGIKPTFQLTKGNPVFQALGEAKQSIFSLTNFHTLTIGEGTLFGPGGPQAAWDFLRAYNPVGGEGYFQGRLAGDLDYWFRRAQGNGVSLLEGAINPEIGQVGGLSPAAQIGARAVGGAVTGFATGYKGTQVAGGSDEEALRNGLITGAVGAVLGPTVAQSLHQALWGRAVPLAKVLTFKAAVEGGAPAAEASTFANNLAGGQNLKAIADSPWFANALRLVATAPDWLISQFRLAGAGLAGAAKTVPGVSNIPGVGAMTANEQLSRDFLLKAVGSGLLTTELLQKGLTGHFTNDNEPGHEFQLELPTGKLDNRGLPENTTISLFPGNVQGLLDLAARRDVGQFVHGRVSPTLGLAADLLKNTDYRGKPIVEPGTSAIQAFPQEAAYVASRYAPIGISGPTQQIQQGVSPGLVAASALTGLKIGHDTASAALFAQRDQIVAQQWPQMSDQIRQSSAYQNAPPARQSQMLADAHRTLTNQAMVLTDPQGIGAYMTPAPQGQVNPTLALLSSAGVPVPASLPQTINYNGRQVQLSPQEQQMRQQVLAQQLEQRTAGYVRSQSFQQQPPEQQYKALAPVVKEATTYADQRVIAAMAPDDRKTRLAMSPLAHSAAAVPYLGGGPSTSLAARIAQQSGVEATAAHQRQLQADTARQQMIQQYTMPQYATP